MLFKWYRSTLRFAVINLDLWQRQTHLGDTDGFLSDIKLIFTATMFLSQGAKKICRKHFAPSEYLWVFFGLFLLAD